MQEASSHNAPDIDTPSSPASQNTGNPPTDRIYDNHIDDQVQQ